MGFRSVVKVLCYYVSSASIYASEVSGTVMVGTCKGWMRRTKGITMSSIWHHCRSISQDANELESRRDVGEWHRRRNDAAQAGFKSDSSK